MKKYFSILCLSILFAACAQQPEAVSVTTLADTAIVNLDTAVAKIEAEQVAKQDSVKEDGEFATYFIVIADTSKDYYFLDKELFALNKKLNLKIDTMERLYNKKKNLIALPENNADEIYAGTYYPRRHPSEHLSLEYLNYYNETSPEKTIALVAGIFGNKEEGDKVVSSIKSLMPNAYVLKAKVFIGCMH